MPATPTKSPAKAPKSPAKKPAADGPAKEKRARAKATHPHYPVMITAALTSLKDKSGSSLQAIVKYVKANYVGIPEASASRSCTAALKKMVEGKTLTKDKASYKLAGDKEAKKPAAKKADKPAAKKPAAKKAATPSKKTSAKSPAKRKPPAKKAAKK